MTSNFRQKSVNVHQFAMVPRADIPRSAFRIQKGYKTTFNSGFLIPIFVDEVLPGDTFNLKMTAFARMATPIFPFMDNLYLESFFFFVPNRLVWSNWQKFMGQQDNPGDSISFVVPKITAPANGWAIGTVADYFGLPTEGQVTAGLGANIVQQALPFRCYNLIWKEWFRDENLQTSPVINTGDGPDANTQYPLRRRGKRHDYFTSCLPWTQKGDSVTMPLSGAAPVHIAGGLGQPLSVWSDALGVARDFTTTGAGPTVTLSGVASIPGTEIYADLSAATSATINSIRQAFQIQRLLERDARGGTRYTEIVRSHFGVISPDARLQRPEYLGGGSTPINVNPIAQTSSTDATTPQGNLAAFATTLASGHGFTQSFTEHGHVIGLVSVRADLTYQQGLRRMWSRSTRYDFYFPVFANLGEQAVLNKEIYATGTVAQDDAVFGYQERWAEYRYNPSEITGLFRSTAANSIDVWHLAQHFTALPTLGSNFIQDTPPVQRVVAVGAEAAGQEFLLDAFFDIKAARPMPLYSVPGLIDHF